VAAIEDRQAASMLKHRQVDVQEDTEIDKIAEVVDEQLPDGVQDTDRPTHVLGADMGVRADQCPEGLEHGDQALLDLLEG
jgi:hypothetical protein